MATPFLSYPAASAIGTVDQLVVGGGIANTFLKDMGNNVGKSLCEDDLVNIAKANGISGFTAEVLRNNNRMQAIFNHSGLNVTSAIEEGVYSFIMDF